MNTTNTLISPHGGNLINRIVNGDEREQLILKSQSLLQYQINKRTLADIECISTGIYSPLTGFLIIHFYEKRGIMTDMKNQPNLSFLAGIPLEGSTSH